MATGNFVAIQTCAGGEKSWVMLYNLCTDVGTVEKFCLSNKEAIRLFHDKWADGYDPIPSKEAHEIDCRIGVTLETGKQSITLETIQAYNERHGRVNGEKPNNEEKIMYLVCDYGVDGRAKESIRYASDLRREAEEWIEDCGSNGKWYRLVPRIVNVKQAGEAALRRIDGLDRVLLGLRDRKPKPPRVHGKSA